MPRPEYPRPELVRPRWLNLNGVWEFAFDDDDRGRREGWHSGRPLPHRIVVPFTFEATLSGIGETAAHPVVWYRRLFDVPDELRGERLLLRIGACDFATEVWVNGRAAGVHRGGYSPIACEIHDHVKPGTNEVVIRVEDRPTWSQPRGKQIVGERPELIDYDRVTGLWQTVWLEPLPEVCIEEVWSQFHRDGDRLVVRVRVSREMSAHVDVTVRFAGEDVTVAQGALAGGSECRLELRIPRPRLWSVDDPALYDVAVELRRDAHVLDAVTTYAGLREWSWRGRSVLLNGVPFVLRGVLDQGYFPGGWYTAPSDADLRRDVELIKAMGFNAVRKHQKAEDPRWLMWADRLGLVVWSEMPSGRAFSTPLVADLTREWTALVRRDRMHPSIMAWVPFNESWGIDGVARSPRQRDWVRALYHLTYALDGSRPVVANDGWQFFVGDLWGIHNYVPDGPFLAETLRGMLAEPTRELVPGRSAALPGVAVSDLPVMVTELGGVAFADPRQATAGGWGYETAPTAQAFEERLRALIDAVRRVPEVSGFVWTQLTDVQQEINGLLYFDRTPKLPLETYRGIFGKPSA